MGWCSIKVWGECISQTGSAISWVKTLWQENQQSKSKHKPPTESELVGTSDSVQRGWHDLAGSYRPGCQ